MEAEIDFLTWRCFERDVATWFKIRFRNSRRFPADGKDRDQRGRLSAASSPNPEPNETAARRRKTAWTANGEAMPKETMLRQIDIERMTLDDRLRGRARIAAGQGRRSGPRLLARSGAVPDGHVRLGAHRPFAAWKESVQRSRLWICEVDPAVSSYLAQPHVVSVPFGEARNVFIPDLRIDYRDRSVGIETIFDRRRPPRAAAMDFARELYEGMGWTYRVVRTPSVMRGFALANAQVVEADKFTKTTSRTIRTAAEFLAGNGGVAAYARLIEALGGGTRGRAALHALIVRGHLHFDIEGRLCADTAIRPLRNWIGDLT